MRSKLDVDVLEKKKKTTVDDQFQEQRKKNTQKDLKSSKSH